VGTEKLGRYESGEKETEIGTVLAEGFRVSVRDCDFNTPIHRGTSLESLMKNICLLFAASDNDIFTDPSPSQQSTTGSRSSFDTIVEKHLVAIK
jgi:hypothetical protein